MNASPREFLDTNVLVYAFTTDGRSDAAEALLLKGCVTSVQALNEFANVARRKLGMGGSEIAEALSVMRELCPLVVPVRLSTHELAVTLARRHSVSMFDAVMIAAAVEAGCETIWTEDMQDGQRIAEGLTIRNPFK